MGKNKLRQVRRNLIHFSAASHGERQLVDFRLAFVEFHAHQQQVSVCLGQMH